MKVQLHLASLGDIAIYRKEAQQSNLVFSKSTEIYLIKLNGSLVGFCGIMRFKNKCIFKNMFIFKEFRGLGYFKQALDLCILMCRGMPIEATCTDMSIREYLRRGFNIIKVYSKFIKVRHENT